MADNTYFWASVIGGLTVYGLFRLCVDVIRLAQWLYRKRVKRLTLEERLCLEVYRATPIIGPDVISDFSNGVSRVQSLFRDLPSDRYIKEPNNNHANT